MFKIFVGNLDYKVRLEQVRELFALYAPIEDLVIPVDPKTKKPRGFAIVMIRDPELGAAAVQGVQGKRLMGRELVVNEAVKKGKSPPAPPEPPRSGPFGPRMFRKSEGRVGGSRNPRRASGSGPAPSPRSGSARNAGGSQAPPSTPAGGGPPRGVPIPPRDPPARPASESVVLRSSVSPSVPAEAADRPEALPTGSAVKARPKSPPPSAP